MENDRLINQAEPHTLQEGYPERNYSGLISPQQSNSQNFINSSASLSRQSLSSLNSARGLIIKNPKGNLLHGKPSIYNI